LHEALLSFQQLDERHTGEHLFQEVIKVLIDFGLIEKLFCITSDNAGNMKRLMVCLSKALQMHGVDWDASKYHISCLNHVINLAVQAFLKELKAIPSSNADIPDLKEKTDENQITDIDGIDDDMDSDSNDIFQDAIQMENMTDTNDDETDFQITMKKLRGIAKVHM